jgi:hypothetical protein
MTKILSAALRSQWLCWGLAMLFAGCGKGSSKGGNFDGEKAPYGPRTPTTQVRSSLTFSPTNVLGGTDTAQVTTVVGQKTIAGTSYDRLATTRIDDPTKTGEYWIKESPNGAVAFAGFSHSDLLAGIVPAATTTFSTPIALNLNAPIGQPQAVTTTASVQLVNTGVTSTAHLTGQYTLIEKDVTVPTGVGPLSGCSHFSGQAQTDSAGVPAIFQGKTINAELWHHPSFGVVAFNAPDIGIGTVMTDSSDCGSMDASNHKIIRKTGVVNPSSSFNLDTYDCDGQQFAADKNTHAAMLLELRWADEAQAKTDTQPMPRVEFGTTIGYFPNAMTGSPASVFHPEENGKGFKYWYSYVNQAAKNEPGDNSTTYHIKVSGVAGLAPVRVTARIYYKVLPDKVGATPDAGPSNVKIDSGSKSDSRTEAGLPSCMIGVGGSTSWTAEWSQYHLNYTVTGAGLASPPAYTAPFGYDIYNYSGTLNGSALTISGTGWVEQASGANDDFNYTLTATVSVGADSKKYTYTAPKDEILNKPFSLSVPIPAGATTGSFTMRVDYANSNYGPRGVVVGGTINGTSCPTQNDGGTATDGATTPGDTRGDGAVMDSGVKDVSVTSDSRLDSTGTTPGGTSCNLIVNGNAEAALGSADGIPVTTPGWYSSGQATAAQYGVNGWPTLTDPGPANRGLNLFSGGPGNDMSSLTQSISVSQFASLIDTGGVTYALSGWLGGFADQDDNATLTVTFQNASNVALGTGSIGPVMASERSSASGLLQRSSTGAVPAGTRTVYVVLSLIRASGSANDGYADNLALVLGGMGVESACSPDAGTDAGATGPDAASKDGAADSRPDATSVTPDGGCAVSCSTGQQCLSGQCCTPPAAGGVCTTFPACGCPAGQVCSPATSRTLACFAGNNLAEGADCSSGLTCKAGLGCFDGLCRPYCGTDADCPAVAGVQSCSATYWDDLQTQPILGVKVCARICDPLHPQSPRTPFLSCPTGFSCSAASTGASFCFKATPLPAGSACTSSADCPAGNSCTGTSATTLVCKPYCFSTSDCATGTCQFTWTPRQYAGNQEVGYCQ